MNKQILFSIVLPFVMSINVCAQKVFFVSTKGKDTDRGTYSKPYATIDRALLEARKTPGRVVINLLSGVYYMNKPIILTSSDSRNQHEELLITNYQSQKVTFNGSVVLKLKWKEYKNGIWEAKISQNIIFDELFVNGRLQHMARYPNYDSSAHYFGGTAADVLSKERVANWQMPEGGYIHAMHSSLWGDLHYIIKGKKPNGELVLEGGWQNNRQMGMHEKYRFVENVFEELDTANEWFYDKDKKILYYFPPENVNIKTAKFETPQIAHLIEFIGSEENSVQNIGIEGIEFTQTLRTFMQNKEPLLRSDWTIYRGGAVFYNGAKNCFLKQCLFDNLGGNAIFFNNYNRDCEVSECIIFNIGASAVCFVGDANAVRSPSFQYYQFVPIDKMDKTRGPKTNNYPARCEVYNNLIHDIGLIEIQSAGVQLSMCQDITVSHNTIYDVPRAGINVNEGTWGGHLIEYNDIFNTVKESGDHGSFNSWGRDRYWYFDKKILDSIVENNFNLALLDVLEPIIIQNNRMRCDHGWDIDLDDGSSNYIIRNNLCLNGGIKLREGVNRIVENNIIINNTFHPHVWFTNSNDIFRHNIVSSDYLPVGISVWGKEVDYNVFPDSASLNAARRRGTDQHSVYGKLNFVNASKGDFRLKEDSFAFSTGFKNFPMDSFGVISLYLKAIAKATIIPSVISMNNIDDNETSDFIGAKIKKLSTPGEQSATGINAIKGLLVLEVKAGSAASSCLHPNDVILALNFKQVNNLRDFLDAERSVIGTNTELLIFRNQEEIKVKIEINELPTAREIAGKMKVGWNLGNSLEATCSETAWGGPITTQQLIDSVKAAGFNTVRIPCSWFCHSDTVNSLIDKAWMERVKQVVDYCVKDSLYVVLNMHWDKGWLENRVNKANEETVNNRLQKYWTDIADNFKDYNEYLLFAAANEPGVEDTAAMNVLVSYYQTFINAVRSTGGNNSYRTLIIQGPDADIDKTNKWMNTLPADNTKSRLMVEVHYYSPFQFCLMGKDASWGKMFYYWGEKYHSKTDSARNAKYGEESRMDEKLELMKAKFVDKGIPVIIGEFGAFRRKLRPPSDQKLHDASIEYFQEYFVKSAAGRGLIPFVWDVNMGLFNRKNGKIVDKSSVEAIMQGVLLAGKKM